jgi:hypothetical protein
MLAAVIAAPKISFETLAMICSSAGPLFDVQKIGLHRRKFHHIFLNIMQGCIAVRYWAGAVFVAKGGSDASRKNKLSCIT